MAGDELTKTLLVEEVATPRAIAEALFASVTGGVPILQALVDSGAASTEILHRYLARAESPFLRQVVPVQELVDRLPRGLCARLLAVPVRRDAITGTIDVVVADPGDPHPANEISFHLQSPVRLVRAPLPAIEEGLRRLRMRSRDEVFVDRFREAAAHAAAIARSEATQSHPPPMAPSWMTPAQPAVEPRSSRTAEEEALYDSRRTDGHRGDYRRPVQSLPDVEPTLSQAILSRTEGDHHRRRVQSLPDVEPTLSQAIPSRTDLPPRRGLVIEEDSVPPPPPGPPARIRTPPWGTPLHTLGRSPSDSPRSGYGSEIPIPLTRKTYHPAMIRGGTERPKAIVNPAAAGLGEGYAIDTTGLRDVVERSASPRIETARHPTGHPSGISFPAPAEPFGSFIPGPPPLPASMDGRASANHAPVVPNPNARASGSPAHPFAPEMGGVLVALRNAGSRDEVLELVLTGARMVATKVALFVVKKGGYLGWVGSPELADRAALQSVLIPLEASSIFDRAVREDLYLGPIRYDEVHAPLLRVFRDPSRDVAVVPIRVSGRTAVVIVADDLGDTMTGTRRLEELARAAGDAFARIVRTRR